MESNNSTQRVVSIPLVRPERVIHTPRSPESRSLDASISYTMASMGTKKAKKGVRNMTASGPQVTIRIPARKVERFNLPYINTSSSQDDLQNMSTKAQRPGSASNAKAKSRVANRLLSHRLFSHIHALSTNAAAKQSQQFNSTESELTEQLDDSEKACQSAIHYASGDWSLANSQSSSQLVEMGSQRTDIPKDSLWGARGITQLEEIEQKLLDEQRELLAVQEAEQQRIEHQRLTRIKTINAVYNKRLSTNDDGAADEATEGESKDNVPKAVPKRAMRRVSIAENTFEQFILGEYDGEGPLPDNPSSEDMVVGIRKSLNQLSAPHVKEKLTSLAKYVSGHTVRKLSDCWNMIESRFKQSTLYKMVFGPDKTGTHHSIKQQALYLSTLASLLCSSRVKLSHDEFKLLIDRHGGIAEQEVHLALNIAAYHVLVNVCTESNNPALAGEYRNKMHQLIRDEKSMISIHELEDLVFPEDLGKRIVQLEQIRARRHVEVQTMIQEKTKREEAKQKTDLSRKKLMDDFEKLIKALQILDHPFNKMVCETFQHVLTYSWQAVLDYNADQSSRVPVDLIYFLGVEAFPGELQTKLALRLHAKRQHNREKGRATLQQIALNKQASIRLMESSQTMNTASLDYMMAEDDFNEIGSFSPNMPAPSLSALKSNHYMKTSRNISHRHLGATSPSRSNLNRSTSKANLVSTPAFDSFDFDSDKKVVSVARIKLAGPPQPALQILRSLVALGRTFPKLSYRDTIEVLQYIAATKVTAAFRGYSRHWRYQAARKRWTHIFRTIKWNNFKAWAQITVYNTQLRRCCWRKVKAWRAYTKYTTYRREIFQACFWPFYVWRKYSKASLTAKEKAKFLVSRVMPTVLLLKVFKAWKGYALQEHRLIIKAQRCFRVKLSGVAIEMLAYWLYYARQRKKIRSIWIRKLRSKFVFKRKQRLKARFMIWRAYSWLRKHTRCRMSQLQNQYRHALLGNQAPRMRFSFVERRLLITTKRRRKDDFHSKMALSTSISINGNGKGRKKREHRRGSAVGSFAKKSILEPRRSVPHAHSPHGHVGDSDVKRGLGQLISSMDGDGGQQSSAVSGPGRSRGGSKPADSSNEVNAKEFACGIRRKLRFEWKQDTTGFFDIDSDGEDEEDVPELLLQSYERAKIPHLPPVGSFSKYLEDCEDVVLPAIESARISFKYRDVWNLFEASMRFHHYARVVFTNLRKYAVNKCRVKRFVKIQQAKVLRVFWTDWITYVQTGRTAMGLAQRDSLGHQPVASEALHRDVRTHFSNKLMRARRLMQEVKNSRMRRGLAIDSDEEGGRSEQRMRNLNLIDADDDEYLSQQRLAMKKRREEFMKRQTLYQKEFSPPNLLDWDRQDRTAEQQLVQKMLSFSTSTVQGSQSTAEQSQATIDGILVQRERIQTLVHEVLDFESQCTAQAVEREREYVKHFKEHAADFLITTLAKVHAEYLREQIRAASKVYFRALRLPMLIARSKHMLQRKRLKNFIRICRRFICLQHRIPYYYRIRNLWIYWTHWLKYLLKVKLETTPGFLHQLRRKLALHPDFSESLRNQGYETDRAYVDDNGITSKVNEFVMMFRRWKMFAQEQSIYRWLDQRCVSWNRLRTLRKCFVAIKLNSQIDNFRLALSSLHGCYQLVRLEADIDQIVKRFFHIRKTNLPTTIRKKNLLAIELLKKSSRLVATFKTFLQAFLGQIHQRVSTEQRLLFEAFETRGSQEFWDVVTPQPGHALVPPIMTKLEGHSFQDPMLKPGQVSQVPAGFRLSRIRWALQIGGNHHYHKRPRSSSGNNQSDPNNQNANNNSNNNAPPPSNINSLLLGWQLIWSADGCSEIESPARGVWHSAGITIHDSVIPKDDFVVGLEYLYDGPNIVGLRLKYFHHGFSRWIGGRSALSTLSVYLDAQQLAEEDNRLDVQQGSSSSATSEPQSLDRHETASPALPFTFIIGLAGMIHNQKPTRLALVVRKVSHQEVFCYQWVRDAMDCKARDEGLEATSPKVVTSIMDNPAFGLTPNVHAAMGIANTVLTESNEQDANEEEEAAGTGNDDAEETDGEDLMADSDDEDNVQHPTLPSMAVGTLPMMGRGVAAMNYRRKRNRTPNYMKKYETWLRHDKISAPLSSAETQFFDVLRMRMTELSNAKTRAEEFARRLWSDRELRQHPVLSRCTTLLVLAGLSRWLFNALSKRLNPLCPTERRGLYVLKLANRLRNKGKFLLKRCRKCRGTAAMMELTRQPWVGKLVLGPTERAMKKAFHAKLNEVKQLANKLQEESDKFMQKARDEEQVGKSLLARISLNTLVYANFMHKIAAARHTENLLERMSLEDIKSGLFGTHMKDTLLSQDQMDVIHNSLRRQAMRLKDHGTLQQFVEQIITEELPEARKSQALVEEAERRERCARQQWTGARQANMKHAPVRDNIVRIVKSTQQSRTEKEEQIQRAVYWQGTEGMDDSIVDHDELEEEEVDEELEDGYDWDGAEAGEAEVQEELVGHQDS